MPNVKNTIISASFAASSLLLTGKVLAADDQVQVDTGSTGLGFQIPTLSDILTFAIRTFFVIGGLAALLMLLLGALSWITSGGDKDSVSKAQAKIQAAVLGVILIAVALAIIATLEQVIFKRAICLGLTCPATIPTLLKKT